MAKTTPTTVIGKMEKWLHKKLGWFECRFSPLDAYEKELQCRWCGCWWKSNGELPYIGELKLTKLPTTPANLSTNIDKE